MTKAPAKRRQPAESPEPGWRPLPPPRRSKPLLVGASVLLVVWVGFLLYLALNR